MWEVDLSEILQQDPFARSPDNTKPKYPDSNNFTQTPDVCDLEINIYYDTASPPSVPSYAPEMLYLNCSLICLMNVAYAQLRLSIGSYRCSNCRAIWIICTLWPAQLQQHWRSIGQFRELCLPGIITKSW